MRFLRRNIGCHLFPDVSTARYTVPFCHFISDFHNPAGSRKLQDMENGSF